MAFLDAQRVKIRDERLVKNKAVYVALALNPDGEKDVLGLWIEQTEGNQPTPFDREQPFEASHLASFCRERQNSTVESVFSAFSTASFACQCPMRCLSFEG